MQVHVVTHGSILDRTALSAALLLCGSAAGEAPTAVAPHLPLTVVADVPLPGRASRFDYQDVDGLRGHLFIAHMGDDEVVVASLSDGSTVKRIPGIRTVRGIRVAAEANLVFATAAGDELVRIDATTLAEVGRTPTGRAPDGVDWDPLHRLVGVSDQRDGALSLIAEAGADARRQVRLGRETGNVVFDPGRGRFWITAVQPAAPDLLVAVDPLTAAVLERIPLPGCEGAHGLRLHPDGKSALVACEGNDLLVRVDLSLPHGLASASVGKGPDVLAIDPGLGWLYVAAERGDLSVFDLKRPGLVLLGRQDAGDGAHTVAVDPATHRVFLPLARGPSGGPVLRILKPTRSEPRRPVRRPPHGRVEPGRHGGRVHGHVALRRERTAPAALGAALERRRPPGPAPASALARPSRWFYTFRPPDLGGDTAWTSSPAVACAATSESWRRDARTG